MRRWRILPSAVLALALALGLAGAARIGAAPALGGVHYVPATPSLGALLVSPTDPRTVYLNMGSQYLVRSADAGATWIDLSAAAGFYDVIPDYRQVPDPPVIGADGRHLYATGNAGGASPASGSRFALVSADGGMTWTYSDGNAQTECGDPQYGAGPEGMFPSPADPLRVYTLVQCGGLQNGAFYVESSADGGINWRQAGNGLASLTPPTDTGAPTSVVNAVVPDPVLAATVYANLTYTPPGCCSGGGGDYVERSDDGGMSWTTVMTPTASPAVTSFAVTTLPSQPGLLAAHATDGGRKPDLLFLSADHGRTWRTATCPGDLHGTCPTITLANVFGAGHSYALFPDGLHAFDGDGPSGPRLAVSDHFPVSIKQISSLVGGTHAGDPVYLLANRAYISTDAGATWQVISDHILPTAPPVAHRVGAAFVATYRKLGTLVLGLPITEPYYEGTVLTQDFEHLRLEVRGGKVVVAHLGALLDRMRADDNWGARCVPVVKNSAKVLFFVKHDEAGCGYTVSGAFLRFYQAHGGLAVFGKAISTPYVRSNGDRSGRKYTMQLFQNARLELHPENANPAYRVELGLFGDIYLVQIGWLTIS